MLLLIHNILYWNARTYVDLYVESCLFSSQLRNVLEVYRWYGCSFHNNFVTRKEKAGRDTNICEMCFKVPS